MSDLREASSSSSAGPGDDALLADMERRGVVRRGKGGPLPPEILQPGPPGPGVVDALLEERRGGR